MGSYKKQATTKFYARFKDMHLESRLVDSALAAVQSRL